jgi:hypothetical protein
VKYAPVARTSLCAVAIALPACWLADFGNLSGAYDDAGSNPDAKSGVEGGTIVDAGHTGDAAEAFCPPDAGVDTYCMDFDGVDAAALGLQLSGATASIVNGPSVSPPSSLSVGVSGALSFGRYVVAFPVQPTATTLEFEMQAPELNEGITTMAISLLETSTQTLRLLNVVVSPNGGFQVQEFLTYADGGSQIHAHGMGTLLDAGNATTWHHAVLSLTVNDQNMTYQSGLTVDGQTIEEGVPLALQWTEGTVGLHIGVTYAATGGGQFFFDNVRASFGM